MNCVRAGRRRYESVSLCGLVREEDGEAVADGVGAVAVRTFQGVLLRVEGEGGLADGASEDVEEVLRDRHSQRDLQALAIG
jgi:hypothetical protein